MSPSEFNREIFMLAEAINRKKLVGFARQVVVYFILFKQF